MELLQCKGEGRYSDVTKRKQVMEKAMEYLEFTECIERYQTEVYSFCLYLTNNNRHEADDLYQDTFLVAWERHAGLLAEQNIKSYLLSVAMRIWKNRKRKYAWRQRIAPEQSFDTDFGENSGRTAVPPMAETGPEEQVLRKEQEEFVRRAVAEMEDKYRLPVCLFYMEQLSIKEIARVLQIPKGTVKSRLFTAKQILKRKLEVG